MSLTGVCTVLVCNMRSFSELLLRWKVFCDLLCSCTVSMDAQDHYPDVCPDVTQTHRSNSSFETTWGISGSELSPLHGPSWGTWWSSGAGGNWPWRTSLIKEQRRLRNPDDHIRPRYSPNLFRQSHFWHSVPTLTERGRSSPSCLHHPRVQRTSLWLLHSVLFSASLKSWPTKSVFSFPFYEVLV